MSRGLHGRLDVASVRNTDLREQRDTRTRTLALRVQFAHQLELAMQRQRQLFENYVI